MIIIERVQTKKQQKDFLNFPLKLYKGNPYFTPPLMMDERKIFKQDFVYNDICDAVYFNAYKDGVMAGRISGILQKAANEKNGKKQVRFTRFDVIEDLEVSKALFKAVEDWAVGLGMDEVVGPLGFSDLEREGMLIDGFDTPATFEESYNHPYYQTFVEALRQRFGGFHKYRVVFAGLQNALRIAERTIHHEPEVVRPRQRLVGFEKFRPDNRPVSEESVARRLVKIPQRPRIESRRPVENRNHPEASVLRKPARDLDFPFLRLHEPDGVRVERPVVSGCLCEYPGEPSGKLTLRSVRSRRSGDKRRDCDSGRNDSSHGRSYRCVTPQCTPRGRRRYL